MTNYDEIDYSGIDSAADEIGKFLVKWGRVNVTQTKEKYGTVRVYCSFGWSSLYAITHPTHHYYRYPKWLMLFDIKYLSRIIPPLTNWAIVPYHKWLYRLAYKRAIAKRPHLRSNIYYSADFMEVLIGL